MAQRIIHDVPGLPREVYTVLERTTSGNARSSRRFYPKVRGQFVLTTDKSRTRAASFLTLDEARQALTDLVAAMQGGAS